MEGILYGFAWNVAPMELKDVNKADLQLEHTAILKKRILYGLDLFIVEHINVTVAIITQLSSDKHVVKNCTEQYKYVGLICYAYVANQKQYII